MIKINLLRGEKKKKSVSIDLSALKTVKIQDLFKIGSLYYAGGFLWLVTLLILGYYFKLNQEKKELSLKLEELNMERLKLQAQAKRFSEEKKLLEGEIERLKAQIQDIDRGKDIILGLKSYHYPFNKSLDAYIMSLPRVSWISNYKQSLDISTQTVKSELVINTFDYQSLGVYGRLIKATSQKIAISPVERKTTPSGFEYYTAKLSIEKPIQEGR